MAGSGLRSLLLDWIKAYRSLLQDRILTCNHSLSNWNQSAAGHFCTQKIHPISSALAELKTHSDGWAEIANVKKLQTFGFSFSATPPKDIFQMLLYPFHLWTIYQKVSFRILKDGVSKNYWAKHPGVAHFCCFLVHA